MKKRLLSSFMERLGFNRLRTITPRRGKAADRFAFETLEPRYLMSADVGGLLAYSTLAGTDALVQPAINATPLLDSSITLNLSGSAAVAATGMRHEVAIIDMAVKNHEQLVEDLLNQPGANRLLDVYVIDTKQDGIGQISKILARYQNLDAVHIISHSSDASLQLGDTLLNGANLNQYAAQIAGWSASLGARADLLFYGCDLAAQQDGVALVNALGTLTGADVAASTDITGNAVLGGNWTLEYASGAIETASALSAQAQQSWMGELASNTAPVLTVSGSGMSLTPVAMNAPAPVSGDMVGTLVSDLVDLQGGGGRDNVTDPDAYAVTGIAITHNDTACGTFYFTTDGGANWSFVGFTSSLLPLQLSADASTRIYYVPHSGVSGTVNNAITFYAWDQSTGTNGQYALILSSTGGTSAYSTAKQTASITIGSNANPTATNLSASEIYARNTPLNLTDIVASDADSPVVSVSLTLSDTSAGSLNTGTYGTATSTFSAATGTWLATGAVSDVNALLAGLTFTPAANYSSGFTIATFVSDGVAPPTTSTKLMTGVVNLSTPETYTEDTPLNLTDIVVNTVNSANVTVTLTLSNSSSGFLNTDTYGTASSTFSAGQWIATGASSDVNVLLAGLTFTPTLNYNGSFSITTNVSDGSASTSGTKAMTGIAVNDAPVNSVPGPQSASSGTALLFDSAHNNAISISDVDAGSLSMLNVTLNATNGTLSLTPGASNVTGNGTGTLTIDGTIDNINATFGSLSFTSSAGFTGVAILKVTTDDNGNTGGGSLTCVNNVIINVDAAPQTLWLSTVGKSDVGGIGLSSWNAGTVLSLGDPNLNLGNSTTTGTLSSVFNINVFAGSGDASVNALDYVSQDTTINTSPATKTVYSGDVIFTVNKNITLNSGTLAVNENDVVLFHPATKGDYSAGSFSILIQNPTNNRISAITLVEQAVTVFGQSLSAGTFLFSENGSKDIQSMTPTTLSSGKITAVATNMFITGASVGIGQNIGDIDLISSTRTIGHDTLQAGTLLVSIESSATVGKGLAVGNTLAVTRNDIFTLNQDSATGNTLISMFMKGSDMGLTSSSEAVSAFGLVGSNTPPTITGTVSGQTITDKVSTSPFSTVTIGDVDSPAQTLTVSVTLDDSAKGGFTTLNGFADAGNGVYTFSGTAAAATSAIQGLVFTPGANHVTPGSTETTTFALSVNDGLAAAVTDNTTTVVSTSVNDAPTITGTISGQSVTDKTTITPFSTVTIGDIDSPAQTLTVSVTLDNSAKGSFTILNGFTDAGNGVYTFSGTAAAATSAIQGLVFTPTENRVAPTQIETTSFTISVTDNISQAVIDNKSRVDSISVNDVPVIAGQTIIINDNVPNGSSAATLISSDPDIGDTRTYAITGGNAAAAFIIDPVTGEVRVADGSVLYSNATPTMTLLITVTDVNGLSATADVTVTINPLSKINNTSIQAAPSPSPSPITIDTTTSTQPGDQSITDSNNTDETQGTGKQFAGGHGVIGTGTSQAKAMSMQPATVVAAENAQAKSTTDKDGTVISPTQAPISLRSAGARALSSLIHNASFARELDQVRGETRHDITLTKVTAGVSIATTTGLSIGYVAWLVRGGALLSSVLSSLPAWRMIDPLPILSFTRKNEEVDDDDESLESMVRKGNLEDAPTDET